MDPSTTIPVPFVTPNLKAGKNTFPIWESFTTANLSTNVVFVEKSLIRKKGREFIDMKFTQGKSSIWQKVSLRTICPLIMKDNFHYLRKDKSKTACEQCGKVVIDYAAHQVRSQVYFVFF